MDNRPDNFVHQFEDVIEMYSEVCEWFNDLGFSYTRNRYGVYKKHFDKFLEMAKDSSAPEDKEELLLFKRSFDNAYIEVNEIIRVYNNLKSIESKEFLEQIKKVVSGQEFRANSDNDQARDFLFELSVACRFIKAGFNVSLTGVCDVVVDLGTDGTLFVECKRIKSENKIDKNVKKANKQIVKRIKLHKSNNVKGLVAINVTDLLPKTNMFFPDSMQATTAIHRGVSNNFIKQRVDKLTAGMTNKCLGVLCESAMMHYFSKESGIPGFSYSRHTEYIPYSDSSLFESLVPKISRQDIK
ncbi:hypothetical protein P3632_22220 [Vibrio parahaemolyticus]|uniref:Uncharacterized protein n=2 Tax=Vibrionaceae TaxID=641 RepID=A0A7Y0XD50_VIBPH|nr:hypothetical protein [Vibrio parahaemolyticus]EGQ9318455.1 hypothetical protein [Vibrio parahaemolyticus]EHH2499570.1 hypothetical protein [Vibrio parahaemolyticus]EJB8584189.1 hypothetical protein [Vibrio parahaemolyticus]EJG0716530.1 hypothetical protein [Vibrio parahaemolyticus]EJG1471764.1 hypothetical protein [Vibrio parahaemolyticus]